MTKRGDGYLERAGIEQTISYLRAIPLRNKLDIVCANNRAKFLNLISRLCVRGHFGATEGSITL